MKTNKELSDFEKIILSSVQSSIHEAIKTKITSYDSPLNPIIIDAFKVHSDSIRGILYEALGECVKTKEFKQSVKEAFYHKVSRALVDGMAGSVDKAVNSFKQDPTIKAKMILAIEEIINGLNK